MSINGDINNIDKEQFPELYDDIANIFSLILPYLNEVRNLSKFEKLNVIVKIQSYQLQDNEAYEGQFHQEGFKKEGIIMVGIYYFHISPNLRGGELELKYLVRKDYDDNYMLNFIVDKQQLAIEEDDIVIFQNRRCKHRVNLLKVISPQKNQIYERKILSFFIADPAKSVLPTSKDMTKLNKIIADNEKEMSYAKRDEFKKSRLNSNSKDADYSESETSNNNFFIEISQTDFAKKANMSKRISQDNYTD